MTITVEQLCRSGFEFKTPTIIQKQVEPMYRSWINLMMLAAESQQVIWLRTMRLAAGGAKAKSEARRMVQEKVVVAGLESGRMALGASSDSVVKSYRRKVRANVRRLSR
jgi:hypothetical protein